MIYYLTKKIFSSNDIIIKTNDIDNIIKHLKTQKILAIDTETNGLSYLNNNVMMLQIGTLNKDQYVIDTRDYDILLFKDILEDINILKIGHNIKFDYNMLKRYSIVLENIYDTMVAEMIIYNGSYNLNDIIKLKRYSLYGVYFHYFKKKIEKSIRNEFEYWGKLPFTESQIVYGSNDVIYTIDIYRKQLKKIEEFDLQTTVNQEMEVVLCLGDMEYNGMKIDTVKWKQNTIKYEHKISETEINLDKHLLSQKNTLKYKKEGYQLDLFDTSFESLRLTDVNWASSTQVLKILVNVYNIKPTDKYGKLSSGAEALMLMIKPTEITNLIKQYREYKKIVSSFGDNIINSLHSDNRLHTTYNQIVETGRISSRKPNLQNIPNTSEFRSSFIAEKDYSIITADYSGQEARIMADQSNDKKYIEFFKSGTGDMHSFIASTMFSAQKGEYVEVPPKIEGDSEAMIYFESHANKHLRDKGKTLNFAISFQSSANSIANRLKITKEEAQGLINAFFEGFPNLKKYFQTSKTFALKYGYIRTDNYTKRIRWFKEWKQYKQLELKSRNYISKEERSLLSKLRGSIERKAANTKVQGTAASITKYALIFIRKELIKQGIKPLKNADVKLIAAIHDEILIECKDKLTTKYNKIQANCMEKAGNLIIKQVELTAKPCISKFWKH